jgi:photosystem II stability/assembly factor-like uncharacterized protein
MGWLGGADHASSRRTPTGSAASGQQPASGGVNVWSRLGPDEDIRSLAIDPSDPKIIYAGSKSGVFKSTDGGASWSNKGLSNARALAIDSVNSNVLYAGTSSSGVVFEPGDRLLYKSTDGGSSWSNSSSPLDFDFTLLVMDLSSGNTLYAGSEGRYVFEGGIVPWKSTDGGLTWNDRRTGNLGLASYGWAINPANSQTIYAPGELYTGGSVTESSLFKSTDGGNNWSGTGLHAFISAVAIDPLNPNTLYAGTTDYGFDLGYTAFLGVFKSTDGGQSWLAINNGLTGLIFGSSTIGALAIDPDDPDILYAATSGRGVFRSADGGASWSEFNSGLSNLSVKSLAIDPIERHVYAATAAGVFAYQYTAPCADPLSPANQSFDSTGGTGFVNVTAPSECRWMTASYANWISVTSDSNGSGNGSVSYSVAANETTATRVGLIGVAGRFLTVRQTSVPLRIHNATVSGKRLFVFGENFDPGAVILLNGVEQNTKNDPQNPKTALIGKKAGKKVKPGDKLQVRNPNGTLSQEFIFTGS